MKPDDKTLDTCGCCEGIGSLTAAPLRNPPGLSAVAYRVGTHGSFKETMKAGLAGEGALGKLATRDDDDPSIALLDAWAAVADVLTFYQERIANEGYLRTAVERRSVLELARSLGYELKPGVAASTYLAFELETAPGSPGFATIDVGTKVQSLPRPGEKPQTFETIEKIEARSAWNEMKPRRTEPRPIRRGQTSLYLKGTDTQLQPGDAVLIVGDERIRFPGAEQWDFRILRTVTPLTESGCTAISWDKGLGWRRDKNKYVNPAAENVAVFAFRQRAALFGYNAPDWRAMPESIQAAYKKDFDKTAPGTHWPDFEIRITAKNEIDLDATYPKITVGSWLVLDKPTYTELYNVTSIATGARTDFTLTAKVSRVGLDATEHLSWFRLRETVVYAQSEKLELAERPLTDPVRGNSIELDGIVPEIESGRSVLVRGRPRSRFQPAPNSGALYFVLDEQEAPKRPLRGDEVFALIEPPFPEPGGLLRWRVVDADGKPGFVSAKPGHLVAALGDGAEQITVEVAEVAELRVSEDGKRSILVLKEALAEEFDPASVTVQANVAAATHGETRREVLGSGDAAQGFQKFVLKQTPLTYVSAPTASGTASTLEVRVNSILWDEAASLYGQSPREQVHITRLADDGTATVQFGDGLTGSRLPSGVENVEAKYRVGIGLAGNVKAKQLSLLMTRPLGVKGVRNPLPATGGADPESRDQARENAPLTVLTLDRVVSSQDYEDFARAFAGIGKAQATWLWRGETRFVHITLAAAGGGPVNADTTLYRNLEKALALAGDPHQSFRLASYDARPFHVKASIRINRRYIPEKVLEEAYEALVKAFSFPQRALAQPVTASEVYALIQSVGGVEAVDLDALYLGPPDTPMVNPFLPARRARWENDQLQPAQLLTLLSDGIVLEEML